MANVLPPERRRSAVIAVRLTPADADAIGAAYARHCESHPAPMRQSEFHRTALLAGAAAVAPDAPGV